jgi:hypothetical protein
LFKFLNEWNYFGFCELVIGKCLGIKTKCREDICFIERDKYKINLSTGSFIMNLYIYIYIYMYIYIYIK